MSAVPKSLSSRLSQYALYKCTADVSHLTRHEKVALRTLIKAGKLFDQIYLRQAWSGNEALQKQLHEGKDKDLALLFDMYKGPWASEDNNTPFIENVPSRPEGGNFYPEDMTKEEFESWLTTLSAEEQAQAKSFYTVIQRDTTLKAVPYSHVYGDLLGQAAKYMREAAESLSQGEHPQEEEGTRMETFLRSRADALESNQYLVSELDWLRLGKTNTLEVTVGPYEVYTDAMFGYKSAFECYVHVRDPASSVLLEKFSDLQFVEDHLPVPEKYRNTELVAAPIVVVNQLYSGGDVAVPMTAAYNLPNDEEAIKHGGSKLVLIKNVQEGKFAHVLSPIALEILARDQIEYLDKDAFTTHILLHEVCHSNGPHHTLAGETVRSKLQEYHSAIEEAKADIAGLFAASLLVNCGTIDNITCKQFWACQLNYLLEKGGFSCDQDTKRFRVNFDLIEQAVSDLTRDILILQGNGDKEAVTSFVKQYGVIDADTKVQLDRIEHLGIPVDIRPFYPAEYDIE
ncbi:hypothetical protein BDF14DRAFT_1883686 [Spinellus fusiger]|nr:hypothetical protein BDF14DRAFT_1883686 [Spinellus fusiger]